jgi:hypothetical protein
MPRLLRLFVLVVWFALVSTSGMSVVAASDDQTISVEATKSVSTASSSHPHRPHYMRVHGGRSGGNGSSTASDMSYGGGPVLTSPSIYLIFWGSAWVNGFTDTASDGRVYTNINVISYNQAFFQSIGGTPWGDVA